MDDAAQQLLRVRQLSGEVVYEGSPSSLAALRQAVAVTLGADELDLTFLRDGSALCWAALATSVESSASAEIIEITVLREAGLAAKVETIMRLAWHRNWTTAEVQEACGHRRAMLLAIERDGHVLQYASAELRKDREVVLAASKRNGYALQWASAELRNDREVVLAAVRQGAGALWYVSQELRGDPEVLAAAETHRYSCRGPGFTACVRNTESGVVWHSRLLRAQRVRCRGLHFRGL
jgi:hypothetical protein